MGTPLDYISSAAGILRSLFFDRFFPLAQCYTFYAKFGYHSWVGVNRVRIVCLRMGTGLCRMGTVKCRK